MKHYRNLCLAVPTIESTATPLLDRLVPRHDWAEEELCDQYRQEVQRRLGANSVKDDACSRFFDHVESAFKRGIPEGECAAQWLNRIN